MVPVQRRTYLGGILAASGLFTSGCLGNLSSPDSTANDDEPAADADAPARHVTVMEYDPIPEDIPFEITAVETAPDEIAPDRPAYLHIGFKNTNEHRPYTRARSPITTQPPFYKGFNDGTYRDERELRVWHTRAPDRPRDGQAIGCLAEHGEEPPRAGTHEGIPRRVLQAGQSTINGYMIAHHGTTCFEPGYYRFSSEVDFWHGRLADRDDTDDGPDVTYDWGFTLAINEDEE